MLATVLQLAGLAGFVAGAALEFGVGGGISAAGAAVVFVGLAMDH